MNTFNVICLGITEYSIIYIDSTLYIMYKIISFLYLLSLYFIASNKINRQKDSSNEVSNISI